MIEMKSLQYYSKTIYDVRLKNKKRKRPKDRKQLRERKQNSLRR